MRKSTVWLIVGLIALAVGATTYFLISKNRLESSRTAATSPAKQPDPNIDPRWVYINEDLTWKSVSKEIDSGFGGFRFTTNERLVVLFPDGKFALITCTIRQADGSDRAMPIPNNGFGDYKGTWKRNDDDTLTVTSRLVSSNKLSDAGIAKGHEQNVEQLVIRKLASDRLAQQFDFNGHLFVPAPKIEGILELLSEPEGDI